MTKIIILLLIASYILFKYDKVRYVKLVRFDDVDVGDLLARKRFIFLFDKVLIKKKGKDFVIFQNLSPIKIEMEGEDDIVGRTYFDKQNYYLIKQGPRSRHKYYQNGTYPSYAGGKLSGTN